MRPTSACLVMLIALMLPGLPAGAQASYELTDEGFVARQAPDPDSPAGQLAAARALIARERPGEALDALEQWTDAHPGHRLTAKALLLRGDAKVAMGDYYKALFDYEQLLQLFPASQQFQTALEREYEIAVMFATGVKRKLWGLRWVPAGGEAEELFIRIQERAPGSALGEKASIALADFYYAEPSMDLATDAYDMFLRNYPRSDLRQWALLRLIQASLAKFRGPEFDASGLIDAAERLRQFRDEFPAAAERIGARALLIRINESLARRDMSTADWYDRTGEDVAAALLYRRLIAEYPSTAAAREALERLEAMGLPIAAPDRQWAR